MLVGMKLTFTVLCVAVSLAPAACGSDDQPAQRPATEPVANVPALCASLYDLFETSDEDLGINADRAAPRQIIPALRRWYRSSKARRLMARALAAAPASIRPDVETIIGGARRFAATGDPAVIETRAVERAQAAVDEFEQRSCPER